MKNCQRRSRIYLVPVTCAAMSTLVGCAAAHPIRAVVTATTPKVQGRAHATASLATQARLRGIDVNFYMGNLGPGNTVANESPSLVGYVKSLGANALSVTFPFFESAPTSSTVVRRSATPTPAQLKILLLDAHKAGLYVVLRPLLDESSLTISRVHWTPPSLSTWFASYRHFLMPYVHMAQQIHVNEFSVGAEFNVFAASSRWRSLDASVRRVYKGRLVYANNWDALPIIASDGGGVREEVDAYPPFPVPNGASIAVLAQRWTRWAAQLGARTVLSEVGIAAQAGEYRHPWDWGSSSRPIVHRVQVRWFTAACHAVRADNLGGIYFWAIPFGSSLTQPSGRANPGSWVATPGAAAIKSCFSSLKAP